MGKDSRRGKKQRAAGPLEERSAGLVVYRDDVSDGRVFLLLDYGRYWDYPKGHVEAGENDRQAAMRELREETSITQATILDSFERNITYFFRHPRRGMVRKTVVFFVAATSEGEVRVSHEHTGYRWVSAGEAMDLLTYPSAREVFTAALAFLARQKA